eukprot:1189682-Prorocentrum_minimum.AAC.1
MWMLVRTIEKGTPVGVVYKAQGPALGSWGDRLPAAWIDITIWRPVEFYVGDYLLLEETSTVSKKHLTLPAERDLPWKLRALLWDGPYKVEQVLKDEEGTAFAYRLKLPQNVDIHNVFSSDRLVKYRGDTKWPSQQTHNKLETVEVEGLHEHVVERIIKHRDAMPPCRAKKRGQHEKKIRRYYLVQWIGLPNPLAF